MITIKRNPLCLLAGGWMRTDVLNVKVAHSVHPASPYVLNKFYGAITTLYYFLKVIIYTTTHRGRLFQELEQTMRSIVCFEWASITANAASHWDVTYWFVTCRFKALS